jgi:hypothetical protein
MSNSSITTRAITFIGGWFDEERYLLQMGLAWGWKWEVAAFGTVINGHDWLMQLKSLVYIQMFPM